MGKKGKLECTYQRVHVSCPQNEHWSKHHALADAEQPWQMQAQMHCMAKDIKKDGLKDLKW